MGAWGTGTFEDDTISDWVYELVEAKKPIEFLKQSLTPDDMDEYMEYESCASILGAAETVHALSFGPRVHVPEELESWLRGQGRLDVKALFPQCVKSLQRLLADKSELHELWKENEELYPEWRDNVLALMKTLGG